VITVVFVITAPEEGARKALIAAENATCMSSGQHRPEDASKVWPGRCNPRWHQKRLALHTVCNEHPSVAQLQISVPICAQLQLPHLHMCWLLKAPVGAARAIPALNDKTSLSQNAPALLVGGHLSLKIHAGLL
jgi:hypothetical protein